jgi:hypothetical protein
MFGIHHYLSKEDTIHLLKLNEHLKINHKIKALMVELGNHMEEIKEEELILILEKHSSSKGILMEMALMQI